MHEPSEFQEEAFLTGIYRLRDQPKLIFLLLDIMAKANLTRICLKIECTEPTKERPDVTIELEAPEWIVNDSQWQGEPHEDMPSALSNPHLVRNAAQRILEQIQRCFHKR
jgi:hypothetical protein